MSPSELEDILISYPGIQDCAVIGVKDRLLGEIPKAFVVKSDKKLTTDEIIKFVRGRINSSDVRFISHFKIESQTIRN